jgi:hypothetical protein
VAVTLSAAASKPRSSLASKLRSAFGKVTHALDDIKARSQQAKQEKAARKAAKVAAKAAAKAVAKAAA